MTRSSPAAMPGGDPRLQSLAKRFGTPLYVYDLDMVAARYRALRAALPAAVAVYYAVKANPSRGLLHLLASLGAGADVASEGELRAARDAGIPGARLVCTGPGKADGFLKAAVAARVRAIHVEGPHELDRVEALAARAGRVQAISIRLNPGWGISERRRIIGGPGSHKFGVDLPTARELLARARRARHLRVTGFQLFNASNVLDARLLARNAARVLRLAAELAGSSGIDVEIVDLGGGLGIPYAEGEGELDLQALGEGLGRALQKAPALLARAQVVLEPGRWLVGPAGSYLTRVMEVKVTRRRRHVVVDGGVHHLLRPALIGTPHRIRLVGASRGRTRSATVSGPLCTSLDVLASSAALPDVSPGDLLAVADAGAYGYTESMPLFLSHAWPAEVGLVRGRAWLLRRPPSVAELLDRQEVPPVTE